MACYQQGLPFIVFFPVISRLNALEKQENGKLGHKENMSHIHQAHEAREVVKQSMLTRRQGLKPTRALQFLPLKQD